MAPRPSKPPIVIFVVAVIGAVAVAAIGIGVVASGAGLSSGLDEYLDANPATVSSVCDTYEYSASVASPGKVA